MVNERMVVRGVVGRKVVVVVVVFVQVLMLMVKVVG